MCSLGSETQEMASQLSPSASLFLPTKHATAGAAPSPEEPPRDEQPATPPLQHTEEEPSEWQQLEELPNEEQPLAEQRSEVAVEEEEEEDELPSEAPHSEDMHLQSEVLPSQAHQPAMSRAASAISQSMHAAEISQQAGEADAGGARVLPSHIHHVLGRAGGSKSSADPIHSSLKCKHEIELVVADLVIWDAFL